MAEENDPDAGDAERATGEAEQDLLDYLEECYLMDNAISASVIRTLLEQAPNGITWSAKTDDGSGHLHLVVMNEATPSEELEEIVVELCRLGASPTQLDGDDMTALQAVLSITAELAREKELTDEALEVQIGAVRGLLRAPQQPFGREEVQSLLNWTRRYLPKDRHPEMESLLASRAGEDEFQKLLLSEELMNYLERRAYDEKAGVEVQVLRDFIQRGAYLSSFTSDGASAMLLVVLNPYSSYEGLQQVYRLLLETDPALAITRDVFKLTPLQRAVDYESICKQHRMRQINPAVLLALMPALVNLLPADMDAGQACFKVSPQGASQSVPWPSAPSPPIPRFLEGDRVLCRVEAPGGERCWEEGVVVGLWYREGCWPKSHPGAPYEVLLDIGIRVFALVDSDQIIQSEVRSKPSQDGSQPARPASAARGGQPARPGVRFQRRLRPDGEWELLDTVSGKARPCSPPDSEEDS